MILVGSPGQQVKLNVSALADFFDTSNLSTESLILELQQIRENLVTGVPPEVPVSELQRSFRLLSELETLFQELIIE